MGQSPVLRPVNSSYFLLPPLFWIYFQQNSYLFKFLEKGFLHVSVYRIVTHREYFDLKFFLAGSLLPLCPGSDLHRCQLATILFASPQPFIRCERFYILDYFTGVYFVKRLLPYPWTGGKRSFLGEHRIPTTLCELRGPVDVKAGMQLLQSAVPLRGDVGRNACCGLPAPRPWCGRLSAMSLLNQPLGCGLDWPGESCERKPAVVGLLPVHRRGVEFICWLRLPSLEAAARRQHLKTLNWIQIV